MSKVEDIYAGGRSDEWGTPQDLWDKLNAQYHFTVDLAASRQNSKCPRFFSKEDSFLKQYNVDGVCWLNPPFSLSFEFFEHLAFCNHGLPPKAVVIYKASNTETKTWQESILPSADWIHFIRGRVNYEGCGKSAPFPSALIGYDVPAPVGIPGVTVWL